VHEIPAKPLPRQSESQMIGALHGFLSSAASDLQVQLGAALEPSRRLRADLVVSDEAERVIVDIRRVLIKKNYFNRVAELEHYLLVSGIRSGILLYPPESPSEMQSLDRAVPGLNGTIRVLAPVGFELR